MLTLTKRQIEDELYELLPCCKITCEIHPDQTISIYAVAPNSNHLKISGIDRRKYSGPDGIKTLSNEIIQEIDSIKYLYHGDFPES